MSRKGGLNLQKHGGALLGTHGITVLVQNNENAAGFTGKTVLLNQQSESQYVQGSQDGGSMVDTSRSQGFDHLISDTPNDIVFNTALAGSGVEWVKASVDELGNISYDVVDTGGVLVQGGSLDNGDSKANIISIIQDSFDSSPEVASLVSNPPETISISNIHNLCTEVSTSVGAATTPVFTKLSDAITITHSSPCSPTNFLEVPQNGKPRRYSEGGEKLSLQDRACLEELERGSQLTPEEKELLENSKKELQALEYQAFQDKSGALMSPSLEALHEEGLEFTQTVVTKGHALPVVSVADCDIEGLVSKIPDGLPSKSTQSLSLLSNNSIVSNTSLGELTLSQNNPVLRTVNTEPSVMTPLVASAGQAETPASGQDAATISITTDKSSEMTQIILTTSQGQQVFHINHADLAASIQGNASAAQGATPVLQPTAVVQEPAKLSNNATPSSSTELQEGYLVIPFGQSGQEQDEEDSGTITLQQATGAVSVGKQKSKRNRENNSAVKWVCAVCNQGFTKFSKLKVHTMNHTGERPYKCSTPGCDWAFTTGYKLKRHEESHQGRKEYLCDFEGCCRKFTTIYNLNTHRKLHERPCTEDCPEPGCGESYPTKRLLDQHMRVHGNSTKSYECPHPGCDRKFYSQYCMGSHMRVHQRNTDLVCPFEGCDRKFDKMCRLKQHTRSHTGERPYPCPSEGCTWAFSTSSKLRRHLHKHTGERKWTCPHKGCGKSFMRMEHLKGHLITHSGQKPFECPVNGCNACFKAKSSMYVHAKKHLNDNSPPKDQKITYYCPLEGCNKKYYSKGALRQHIEKRFQKQHLLHNTLGDLIPLLNVEDLDSLVQGQADAAQSTAGVATASSEGLLTSEANNVSIINQVDLLAAGDHGSLMSTASLPDDVSQILATQCLGSVTSGGLPLFLTQIKQELKGDSLAGNLANNTLLTDKSDMVAQSVMLENNSGSARTDFKSNHLLSHRAKKRRQMLKDKSTLDLSSISDLSVNRADYDSEASPNSNLAPMVNPNEIMTSRAITFRDPETGAIYVQTQLLQDDPPDPDYSGEESMDDDHSGLSADLSSLLQDSQHPGLASPPSNVEFTSTTINLQDLE